MDEKLNRVIDEKESGDSGDYSCHQSGCLGVPYLYYSALLFFKHMDL
jgi:hypothetical protein